MSTAFLRTVGNLLDLYLRNMSFLGAHFSISCTLILPSQWMAQDKIRDVSTLPHWGWTVQSLPYPRPVLFQLYFRNSSLLEFSSSITINIWFFRFSQYFTFFLVLHIFIVLFILSLNTIKLCFSPFEKNIFIALTEIIHAYCKIVDAEMLK